MAPVSISPESPDISLHIEGMTCGACVARVDKALRSVPGVQQAAVNLTTGIASVSGSADPMALVQAVDRAGYTARSLAGSSATTLREVAERGDLHQRRVADRLLLGICAGMPVLLIDFLMDRHHSAYAILVAVQAVLATAIMLFTGRAFFTGAWRAVRHGSANMDVLVALGSGVAYVYSVIIVLLEYLGRVPRHVYHTEFHAAVTIVVLVTLGKWLEARAKRRAASAVAGLASNTAPMASRRAPDGTLDTIPAEEIQVGDILQVVAHQQLPVDGTVTEGTGSADLSVITGESVPVDVATGTALPGGATLADGRILLRATSTAAASTVARILELVNAAQASKTQIQGLADRVAAIFVPIVLALGALNFMTWMFLTGDWQRALLTTIATLVIACPCAMGLATPTAITVALGTAARLGILFTQASALESARRITMVLFDKTGTLTVGKPQLTRVVPAEGAKQSEDQLLQRAASMEQFSDHPLAQAIVTAAAARNLALSDPASFHSMAGGGVRAGFDDGEFLAVSPAYLLAQGLPLGAWDRSALDELQKNGFTLVVLFDLSANRVAGFLALQDALRPDAAKTLEQLRAQGVRVGVLSGDSEEAVRATLGGLALDLVRAQVRPEQKAAAVVERRGEERVAFVGDGINDAPALAAADLGIAMATGTDLAKAAGDVLLTSNRLTAIPQTLTLSRRTLRIIRQNLFWAFAYNVAAIPLAMAGQLSPGVAAGAMILSSLTVVLNALRLRRT